MKALGTAETLHRRVSYISSSSHFSSFVSPLALLAAVIWEDRGSLEGEVLCASAHGMSTCPEAQGAIAKRLKRQIRNLFLYEGAGSSPAGVGQSCISIFWVTFFLPK